MEKKLNFYRFNLFNLFYTLVVIGWGAFVRASGSGAGCGAHWPLCNGQVIPNSQKLQTLIEFTHRSSSGVSLALVALGFIFAWRLGEKGSPVRRAAGFTVIAILIEAMLGAALVLLRLVEFDQSALRAVSISLHLINTLFLLGSIVTLSFFSRFEKYYQSGREVLFPKDPLFRASLAAFLVLGVSGAVTALGDTLFPSQNLMSGMAEDFNRSAHFLVRLRVWHPFFASAWIVLVFTWSRKLETLALKNIRAYLLLAVIVQFCLGFLNWMLRAPTFMQIVHLEVADAVMITLWISGLKYETRESRLTT